MMTVKQLRDELAKYPDDMIVHLDVSNNDAEWEGDRVVRTVYGVREQHGCDAVAIDADVYNPYI